MTTAGNSNIKATYIFPLAFVRNLSARSVVIKLWEDLPPGYVTVAASEETSFPCVFI